MGDLLKLKSIYIGLIGFWYMDVKALQAHIPLIIRENEKEAHSKENE